MSTDAAPAQSSDAVSTIARAHERDLYLTALLAPKQARPALLAIAAFVGDVGRIPLLVREPMIGEIRLQWWRDTLEAVPVGLASGHPVADAMADAIRTHHLPVGLAQGIVDAQTLWLYDAPPRDELELRQHLAKTYSAAFDLGVRAVDPQAARQHADYIRDAGIAYGIARLATELAPALDQGRCPIPASWLADDAIDAATLFSPQNRIKALRYVTRLCDAAEQIEANLRIATVRPPPTVHSVTRAMAMVRPYCRVVRKAGEAALLAAQDVMPLTRVVRIWLGR